jgi:hypothetical protein
MKWIDEPIEVDTCKGWPVRYRRGPSTVHVRDVVKLWVYQTRWWAREERREYFRLATTAGVVDIYRCLRDIRYVEGSIQCRHAAWVLARVAD